MKDHNMFDSEQGQTHRLLILGKLNELMKRWIVQVSIEKVRALLALVVSSTTDCGPNRESQRRRPKK